MKKYKHPSNKENNERPKKEENNREQSADRRSRPAAIENAGETDSAGSFPDPETTKRKENTTVQKRKIDEH